MNRSFEQQLHEDYMHATAVAEFLGLDRSHTGLQIRSGKFPGAFKWGPAGAEIWFVPRAAVIAYRGTHLDADRYRRNSEE